MQPINKYEKRLAKKWGKERYKVEFVVEEQNEEMAKSFVEWIMREGTNIFDEGVINLKRIKLTKVT